MVNSKSTEGSLGMMRAIPVLGVALLRRDRRGPAIHNPLLNSVFPPTRSNLPACDNTWVTGRINDRFQQTQTLYWNSTLTIAGYDRFKEIGFRANGVSYSHRRYCIARVMMSDQKERTIIYFPRGRHGHHRLGWGVEWCVVGLDRNSALFAGLQRPACRPLAERYLGA